MAQDANYIGTFALGGVDQAGNSVGWNFVADNSALQVLRDGEVRIQNYAVTVSDGRGGFDTETVTVTLTGVNDAPVLDLDANDSTHRRRRLACDLHARRRSHPADRHRCVDRRRRQPQYDWRDHHAP